MDAFDYFNNWNKTLRWIAFIPMLFIAYTISFFVGRFIILWTYGFVGLDEETIFGYLISHFYSSFCCFVVPILVSVSCAPKGKIIIASVYLGIILLLLGFSTFSVITYGDVNHHPLWKVFYDYLLNLLAGIISLVSVIYGQKQVLNNEIEM